MALILSFSRVMASPLPPTEGDVGEGDDLASAAPDTSGSVQDDSGYRHGSMDPLREPLNVNYSASGAERSSLGAQQAGEDESTDSGWR